MLLFLLSYRLFRSLVNLLNTTTVPNLQHTSLIDVSLTKLFQCMSIAYRQKLTSPKWNRFLGMKLRWKVGILPR